MKIWRKKFILIVKNYSEFSSCRSKRMEYVDSNDRRGNCMLKIYINTYNVAVIVKEMAKLCRKFTWKERMIYEISVNKGWTVKRVEKRRTIPRFGSLIDWIIWLKHGKLWKCARIVCNKPFVSAIFAIGSKSDSIIDVAFPEDIWICIFKTH